MHHSIHLILTHTHTHTIRPSHAPTKFNPTWHGAADDDAACGPFLSQIVDGLTQLREHATAKGVARERARKSYNARTLQV